MLNVVVIIAYNKEYIYIYIIQTIHSIVERYLKIITFKFTDKVKIKY